MALGTYISFKWCKVIFYAKKLLMSWVSFELQKLKENKTSCSLFTQIKAALNVPAELEIKFSTGAMLKRKSAAPKSHDRLE